MTTEREPRTEAGRALLRWWASRPESDPDPTWRTGKVLAIEAEAARETLERVRRAVEELDDPWPVEGAKDDDPRDDWCRKRDVLAAIEEASR